MNEALAATRSSSARPANRSNCAPESRPDEADWTAGRSKRGAPSSGESRRSAAIAGARFDRGALSCDRVGRAAAGPRLRLAEARPEPIVAGCPAVAGAVLFGLAGVTSVEAPGDRPVGAAFSWTGAACSFAGVAFD